MCHSPSRRTGKEGASIPEAISSRSPYDIGVPPLLLANYECALKTLLKLLNVAFIRLWFRDLILQT
jgi:hypothetical protein